jgi:hypothetical protein
MRYLSIVCRPSSKGADKSFDGHLTQWFLDTGKQRERDRKKRDGMGWRSHPKILIVKKIWSILFLI